VLAHSVINVTNPVEMQFEMQSNRVPLGVLGVCRKRRL
jgi:hypothetical protein